MDEPVTEVVLAQVLERPRREVASVLRQIAAEYIDQGRGFQLRERAAGGSTPGPIAHRSSNGSCAMVSMPG